MANNQSSTNYEGVCEKIYKVICPQSSIPTDSDPTDQKKRASKAVSTEVPINFNTSNENELIAKTQSGPGTEPLKARVASANKLEKAKPVVLDTAQPGKAVVGSGHAQVAIVAPKKESESEKNAVQGEHQRQQLMPKAEKSHQAKAGVGQGPENGVKEEENSNDKFSNYIDNARAKMRTTSGIGVGGGDDGGGFGGGKKMLRRDSFHDKVNAYINRARIKIRGGGGSVPIK